MGTTVLCADADRQLFKILEKALRDAGYRLVAAHDGDQALALVRDEAPDVIVLDITMPRRDGFAVLEEIRGLDEPIADVPVLLTCAGSISPQYVKRANELGAQALLAKPVALDDLLARVSECVKTPPNGDKRVKKGREGSRVEGDLAEIEFPHLLHKLHGLRATGVLMISNGKKKKAIQLRDGVPVSVKSNLVGECLGNYLVGTGKLSQEAVTESLARMKKGEGLQGQILVAMDVITEDEITAALRVQAEDKLYEIFEWRRGSFKLELGSRIKRGNALALEASAANVILEGVRRWTPLAQVDAFFARNGQRPVNRAKSPFYRFQDVELSASEQALVERLDGVRTLSELTGEDEAMRRAFFGLVAAELLELDGEPSEPEASAATPASRPSPASASAANTAPRPASGSAEDGTARKELTAMCQRLRGKSYFEMLGVPESAGDEQIEAAYEKLAKKAHPDRFVSASEAVRKLAEEAFELVSAAHGTLIDPKSRAEYLTTQKQGATFAAAQAHSEQTLQAEVEFQHGESLLRQRDYERALTHFTRCKMASPRDGEYLAHYAWCFYLCNPDNSTVVQEALAHMKRAVKLARDREKPYLFLGRLSKVVGDGQGAERMFTRAVQIRPDCVEAMRELRLINMRKDKGRGLIGRLLRR
jgi:CheY-like chemotaxis protein